MDFALGLLSNVLANVVFWIGLGLTVWSLGVRTRRRFVRFFGLQWYPALTVHLSNLWSPATSARPAGYTISMHEFRAAQSIGRLFADAPMRLPELVRGLIDGFWLRHVPQPDVSISPPTDDGVDLHTNAIIVGSAARNVIRASFVADGLPYVVMDFEEPPSRTGDVGVAAVSHARICRGARKGEVIASELGLALIERVNDPEKNLTFFFCLGARADGSWAAVEYLVRNWIRLSKEFGDNNFALCLGFPMPDAYLEQYVEPRRLASLPV